MEEWTILNWLAQQNYSIMMWVNTNWWWCWIAIFFLSASISMAPISIHHEHSFFQIISVWIRRVILLSVLVLTLLPFILWFLYDMTSQNNIGASTDTFVDWFSSMATHSPLSFLSFLSFWQLSLLSLFLGWTLRLAYNRYVITMLSSIYRRIRRSQSNDSLSDITVDSHKFRAKNFLPNKHYTNKGLTVGVDQNNNPVIIPLNTWYETNMQIVGPTRYGKGVIIGCLMDQITRLGDTLFYIDPKDDKFAAHVMYQAAKETGRKFYYVSMNDDEVGKWGPFMGGTEKDAFARLESALGLELTGDPGTDFYKTQEIATLRSTFKKTRRVESMLNEVRNYEANKIEAELSAWKEVKSLCPKSNKGFSIKKAIEENAIVYFKGSLDDRVIKTATKMFIVELVQESRRMSKAGQKPKHLTAIIDEVSFLVSRQLKEALATAVGFGVNFVNAYQSPEDLINTDDINLNGKALRHSIDTNSQLKAVYGGADVETAEWASKLSGTTIKEVTKLERTEIQSGGGETWENNRSVGAVEENLIHQNIILSLPARVCVFIQPGKLLEPLFTSFVPVKNMGALNEFLIHKNHTTIDSIDTEKKATNKAESPIQIDNDLDGFLDKITSEPVSHAKLEGEEVQHPSSASTQPTNKTSIKQTSGKREKTKPLKTVDSDLDGFLDKIAPEPVSHAKLEGGKAQRSSSTQPQNPNNSEIPTKEATKKKEKNKARRIKQKAKRKKSNTVNHSLAGYLDNVSSDDELLKKLSQEEGS